MTGQGLKLPGLPSRLVGAFALTFALALGLAACGGGSDDDEPEDTTTVPAEAASTERGDVLPEIVVAAEAVIARLEAEGAVPDDEARARAGDEFDASQRLRFPPGGSNCRIRAIAAGSAPLVEFTQRAPIYDHVVTDDEETVAVALDLPTVDPDAPASVRCIDAVSAALATVEDGTTPSTTDKTPPTPQGGRPTIEIRGSGVTTSTGGFFTGALVENTGSEDLLQVDVGFDVLNAAENVIGAGKPARISVLPAGETVAAATNTTEFECECESGDIATVRTRFKASGSVDEAGPPAAVTGAEIRTAGADLVISGTIENPDTISLSSPIVSYVVRDANGAVMSGNVALTDVSVPGEGSAPFETTPPSSFTESLPRPAADVVVSVAD